MADRYLLESGAPDGYLLEDGSGVLLLEGTSFDPSTGFPFPQPEVPVRSVPRATALLCAACVFVPVVVVAPFDPALLPFPQPVVPTRTAPRASSLLEMAARQPPPQFGTAVRLVGEADANGLRITTNLPGPTNWTLKLFFYVPSATLGGGDHSVFTLEDSTPNAYQVVEVSNAGDLFWNSFGGTALFLEQPIQRDRWFVLIASISTGGAGVIYWKPASQPGALKSQAISDANTTMVPAALTLGSNGFVEPFNGRFAGAVVWNRALSAGEAALEAASIGPANTAGVTQWWKTETAPTKLVDSSGFGRNLTAKGAGTWTTEEGPLLAPGPWDPQLGPFPSPIEQVRAPRRAPIAQPSALVQLVTAAPSVQLDWLPTFPDFARGPRRPTPDAVGFVQLAGDAAVRLDWFAPPSDPVRRRPLAQTTAPAFVQLAGDAAVRLDWFAPPSDPVRRRPLAQSTAPAFVALVAAPAVSLDWLPVAADLVRRRPSAQGTAPAFVALVAAPAVSLDWLPPVAELTRRRPTALGTQPAFVALVGAAPLVSLDWLTPPADPARAPRRAVATVIAFVPIVAPPAPVNLDWLPLPVGPQRPAVRAGLGFITFISSFSTRALPYSFGGASRADANTQASSVDPAGRSSSAEGDKGPSSVSEGGSASKVFP